MELIDLKLQGNKPLFPSDIDPEDFNGVIIVCIGEYPVGYIIYKDNTWVCSSTINCTSDYSNKNLNNLIKDILEEDNDKTFKVLEF